GPLSMSVLINRSRSASVDQRSMTMSTISAPGRPTLLMFTASAVKRSGVPLVCASASADAEATAPARVKARATRRTSCSEFMHCLLGLESGERNVQRFHQRGTPDPRSPASLWQLHRLLRSDAGDLRPADS